jgi:hypothetical protein
MDNFELERILEETGCKSKGGSRKYKVVASDELEIDRALPPGTLRIANLDTRDSGLGGWHWVVFYVAPKLRGKYKVIYYFDSLGKCPQNHGNFKRFINKYNLMVSNKGFNVQFNKNSYPESTTCGVHCLYISHKLCGNKYTLEQVMQTYRQGTSRNDVMYNECMVMAYVLKKFVKHSKVFNKLKGCYKPVSKMNSSHSRAITKCQ